MGCDRMDGCRLSDGGAPSAPATASAVTAVSPTPLRPRKERERSTIVIMTGPSLWLEQRPGRPVLRPLPAPKIPIGRINSCRLRHTDIYGLRQKRQDYGLPRRYR
jgi:hypothetical protein